MTRQDSHTTARCIDTQFIMFNVHNV